MAMVQKITIQIITIIMAKKKTAKKYRNQRSLAKRVEKIEAGVKAEIVVVNIKKDLDPDHVRKSQSEANRKKEKKTKNGIVAVEVVTEDEDVVLDLDHALDQEVVQGEETVREVIQEIEEIVADIHDQDHQ